MDIAQQHYQPHLPRVIALCGARRVGKDTLAAHLVSRHGYEHIKITAPLKQVCKTLFSFTDDQLETDIKEAIDERWGVSPRQVMQFLGTEVFQYKIQELLPGVGRNFWVNSMVNMIEANPEKRYVISDMRFLHEFEALRRFGMLTVKISSPHVVQNNTDAHVSEQEHTTIREDVHIANTSSREDMYSKIDSFLAVYYSYPQSQYHPDPNN